MGKLLRPQQLHQPWQPTSTTAAPPSPCLAARTTVFVFLRQHSASEPHITTQMCTFHKITKRSTTAASDLDLLTTTPPTSGSKQAQSRIPLRHQPHVRNWASPNASTLWKTQSYPTVPQDLAHMCIKSHACGASDHPHVPNQPCRLFTMTCLTWLSNQPISIRWNQPIRWQSDGAP